MQGAFRRLSKLFKEDPHPASWTRKLLVSLEKVKSVPGEKYKAAARTVHNNTFNSPIVCGDTAGDSVVTSL